MSSPRPIKLYHFLHLLNWWHSPFKNGGFGSEHDQTKANRYPNLQQCLGGIVLITYPQGNRFFCRSPGPVQTVDGKPSDAAFLSPAPAPPGPKTWISNKYNKKKLIKLGEKCFKVKNQSEETTFLSENHIPSLTPSEKYMVFFSPSNNTPIFMYTLYYSFYLCWPTFICIYPLRFYFS